jgi:hypothetical protein
MFCSLLADGAVKLLTEPFDLCDVLQIELECHIHTLGQW